MLDKASHVHIFVISCVMSARACTHGPVHHFCSFHKHRLVPSWSAVLTALQRCLTPILHTQTRTRALTHKSHTHTNTGWFQAGQLSSLPCKGSSRPRGIPIRPILGPPSGQVSDSCYVSCICTAFNVVKVPQARVASPSALSLVLPLDRCGVDLI